LAEVALKANAQTATSKKKEYLTIRRNVFDQGRKSW
jgi:hypothetical protein